MRILVYGSGPAAFLFALLAQGTGRHAVTMMEEPVGPAALGAVFDERSFAMLSHEAPMVVEALGNAWRQWDAVEIRRGDSFLIGTGRRHAVAEETLLAELRRMARAAGVAVAPAPAAADLIVHTEPQESRGDEVTRGRNRMLVAEAEMPLAQPRISVRESAGATLHAQFMPIFADRCRIVIEGPPEVAALSAEAAARHLSDLYAPDLDGRSLRPLTGWQPVQFHRAARRHAEGVALLGRAAATSHYALMAETRAGIEDALALHRALVAQPAREAALEQYEAQRRKAAESLERASAVTQQWCENLPLYRGQSALTFAFSALTRHYRSDYETLRQQAPEFIAKLEAEFGAMHGRDAAVPPMFCPLRLRGLELPNRIVFSPMAMRQGTREAMPTDFHLVHLGSRAMGGAGLIFGEMTAVSPEGRISLNCVGLYRPEHLEMWRRIVAFVHGQSTAKIGLQLGHAGRKGGTRRAPDGRNIPLLEEDEWQLLSASPLPWSRGAVVPKEVDRTDMDKIVADYVAATERGAAAGFDLLEIHMAHGYLLSSFISPATNRRSDGHGGTLSNRMRFPLEVFTAVRAAWPAEKPITVRLSAYDWLPDGLSLDEAVEASRLLKAAGCDMITVSSGHTTSGIGAGPDHGRLYQVPFSDRIRNEVGIPTMAVGTIFSWGDANTVLASGRADLCAIGRGHLYDPYFTRHAAYAQGYEMKWPSSYRTAALFKPHRFG